MTFPRVQFVASPDVGADVRFDFNTAGQWADEETWPDHEAFSLGSPSLQGDPDGVGVEYGLRQLSFNLIVRASAPAAAKVMSSLARELQRDRNWLLFQFSEFSEPVWFRTFRSGPGDLSFERVRSTDSAASQVWGMGVTLDAEAFAYGARETLPKLTIGHNPTNPGGLCAELPAIKGDAPAPLRIQITPYNVQERLMVATTSGTPGQLYGPIYADPGDADTSTVAAASAIAGSCVRTTFNANKTLKNRAYTWDISGRYRMYVRMRAATADSKVGIRVAVDDPYPVFLTNEMQPTLRANAWQWVDLGLVAGPYGAARGEVFNDSLTSSSLSLYARSISGSAVDFDTAFFVPVDTQWNDGQGFAELDVKNHYQGGGITPTVFLDGDTEAVAVVSISGNRITPLPSSLGPTNITKGSYPFVRPAQSNSIFLVRQVCANYPGGNSATATDTVTLSYRPRYLWLAS